MKPTMQTTGERHPVVVSPLGSLSAFIAYTSDEEPDYGMFQRCREALDDGAELDDDPTSARENIEHLQLCFDLEERLMKYRQCVPDGLILEAVETVWDAVDLNLKQTWATVRGAARELYGQD